MTTLYDSNTLSPGFWGLLLIFLKQLWLILLSVLLSTLTLPKLQMLEKLKSFQISVLALLLILFSLSPDHSLEDCIHCPCLQIPSLCSWLLHLFSFWSFILRYPLVYMISLLEFIIIITYLICSKLDSHFILARVTHHPLSSDHCSNIKIAFSASSFAPFSSNPFFKHQWEWSFKSINSFKTIQPLIASQIKFVFPTLISKASTCSGLWPPFQSQFVPFSPLGTKMQPHGSPNTPSFVPCWGLSLHCYTLGLKRSSQYLQHGPSLSFLRSQCKYHFFRHDLSYLHKSVIIPTSLFSIPISCSFPS